MAEKRYVKALAVDSDAEIVITLQRYFRNFEEHIIETEYVSTITGAIEKIAAGDIDLCILDNKLSSGIMAGEVLKNFSERNIDIPVLVLTGTNCGQNSVELMKMGAYDCISKDNIDYKICEKAIKNTIERHSQVAEQKHVNRMIKRAKNQQQLMLDCSPEMIWYSDKNGRIVRANMTTAKVAGMPIREIIGKSVCELFGLNHEDVLNENEDVTCSGKARLGMSQELHTVKGKRWFHVDVVPYPEEEEGAGVVVFARDITEEKLVEGRKNKIREKLIEQDRIRSGFIGGIAHDLREQLGIFRNVFCDSIHGEISSISGKLWENVKIAEENIDRLAKIINDFFDISKIETGKIQIQKAKVNLEEVISEVVYLLADMASQKQVKISTTLQSGENTDVYADRGLIVQVLISLINHAIQATQPYTTIDIGIRNIGKEVQIDTLNTYVGLNKDEISKVFSHFVKIEDYAPDADKQGGTGLYIAKWLVQTQGGRIWVENCPGREGIFCFTLPKYSEDIDIEIIEQTNITQETPIKI